MTEQVDFVLDLLEEHVARLREISLLWEMAQEEIDLKEIQWSQDVHDHSIDIIFTGGVLVRAVDVTSDRYGICRCCSGYKVQRGNCMRGVRCTSTGWDGTIHTAPFDQVGGHSFFIAL